MSRRTRASAAKKKEAPHTPEQKTKELVLGVHGAYAEVGALVKDWRSDEDMRQNLPVALTETVSIAGAFW